MQRLKLLLGFIPWFAFYAINHNTPESIYKGSLVALVLIILFDKNELKQKFILPWASIIFFTLTAVIAKFNLAPGLLDKSIIILHLALPAIIWLSIFCFRPFTLQYAKQLVDKNYWNSRLFIRTNWILSLMWAIILSISVIPYIILPEQVIVQSWFWNYAFAVLCIIVAIKLNSKIPGIIIGRNFWAHVKNLPPPDTTYLKGGFAPVKEETTLNSLPITGHLPKELNGTYLRNGANPYFIPYTYTFPFDGDGMIHEISLHGNTADYKNRFVKTKGLTAEIIAGRALYAGIKLPIPADPRLVGDEARKNAASINIIPWGSRLLALYEASPAYVLDQELNTLGVWSPLIAPGSDTSLQDIAKQQFNVNAHYRTDPGNGHTYMFTYGHAQSRPYLEVYEFDSEQRLLHKIPVIKARSNMIHDLVLTENYIVLFDCPAFFNPADDRKPFLSFEADATTSIILINRFSHEVKWVLDIPYFWVYHLVNAYEEDHNIVVDFIHYGALQLNPESKIKYIPKLYHGEIDLRYLSYSHYELLDSIAEFPSYNLKYTGQKYRYAYMTTKTPTADNLNAILKYDFIAKIAKVIEFGENMEVDEAIFVAKDNPDGEDDGYLLLFLYNTITDKSAFIIMAAYGNNDIVARIELPLRVPHGLHGSWIKKG